MSSVRLLDDTRKINAILHRKNSGKVAFNDICDAMRSVLDSNVLVLSKKGKILGMSAGTSFDEIGTNRCFRICRRYRNSLMPVLTKGWLIFCPQRRA